MGAQEGRFWGRWSYSGYCTVANTVPTVPAYSMYGILNAVYSCPFIFSISLSLVEEKLPHFFTPSTNIDNNSF